MLFGPAGLMLYRLYQRPLTVAGATDAALKIARTNTPLGKAWLIGGFVTGFVLLGAILAQTLHNIIFDTYYGGSYFCEQVAGI